MAATFMDTSDFVKLRQAGAYYVDKSHLIRAILDTPAEALMLTRPRRFGKTLNLTMLQAFFNFSAIQSDIFADLVIAKDASALEHQGAYAVVYLTLKDVRCACWSDCLGMIQRQMSRLFSDHQALLVHGQPNPIEQSDIQAMLQGQAPAFVLENGLFLLTRLLHRATGKKVVLLIDEYDTPIYEGYLQGYKQEIVKFMGNMLGAALKDNPHLYKSVVTGILRVAEDSIFSGLNNIRVYGVLDQPFSDCFGFTEADVDQLLFKINAEHRRSEAAAWYNGYRFGDRIIYNPWSILSMAQHSDAPLCAHWIHTSGNEIVRDLVNQNTIITAQDLEVLLQGQTFEREIKSSLALDELNADSVWSLLLHSGYLTYLSKDTHQRCVLKIPNLEVRTFFDETVRSWLGPATVSRMTPLLLSLVAEDLGAFTKHLAVLIRDVLSYHDTAKPENERVYHVFILGVLTNLESHYQVTSNLEAGYGRYDLALAAHDMTKPSYIIELKRAGQHALDETAITAMDQIKKLNYDAQLERQGHKNIHHIGIAFQGKRVVLACSKQGQTLVLHHADTPE